MNKKTYKNLAIHEETELALWLSYLKESLGNARMQMTRWNRSKNNWELEIFFNAIIYIENAIVGLKKFLNHGKDYYDESTLWNILKQFKKDIKTYNIRNLRNDLVHREKIFQLKDGQGKPLPHKSILIFGGYNFTTDEYKFEPNYKIKVSEIFTKAKKLRQNIARVYVEKLRNFYSDKNNRYESMIPFGFLRDFERRHRSIFKLKEYLKTK